MNWLNCLDEETRLAWIEWFSKSDYSQGSSSTTGFNDLNEDGTE